MLYLGKEKEGGGRRGMEEKLDSSDDNKGLKINMYN